MLPFIKVRPQAKYYSLSAKEHTYLVGQNTIQRDNKRSNTRFDNCQKEKTIVSGDFFNSALRCYEKSLSSYDSNLKIRKKVWTSVKISVSCCEFSFEACNQTETITLDDRNDSIHSQGTGVLDGPQIFLLVFLTLYPPSVLKTEPHIRCCHEKIRESV